MEEELREALARIDVKLDSIKTTQTGFAVECAKSSTQNYQMAASAHKRIDDLHVELRDGLKSVGESADEAHGPGPKGWVAIVAAILTAIAGALATVFGGNTK